MPDEARNLLCERRYRPLAVLSRLARRCPGRASEQTSFVCERVRKAAASGRQPQRAEREYAQRERTSFLSANDDEVGESIA